MSSGARPRGCPTKHARGFLQHCIVVDGCIGFVDDAAPVAICLMLAMAFGTFELALTHHARTIACEVT